MTNWIRRKILDWLRIEFKDIRGKATGAQIAPGTIGSYHLGISSVGPGALAANSVRKQHLASDATGTG